MLARLRHVKMEVIKSILHADADYHAQQGIYLEHLWQNVQDSDEVLFLFRVDSLDDAKAFIAKVHGKALKDDPNANLPQITFLRGEEIGRKREINTDKKGDQVLSD